MTMLILNIFCLKNQNLGLSRSEIKGYIHKIGNLTLISKKLNSQMGNIELEKKILF